MVLLGDEILTCNGVVLAQGVDNDWYRKDGKILIRFKVLPKSVITLTKLKEGAVYLLDRSEVERVKR